MQCGQHWAQDT